MKNNICIITSAHPPFTNRIFHKQAKSLIKAGYDVTIIAQGVKEQVIDGIKFIPLPKPKNRLHRMIYLNWQAYKEAKLVNAQVYHLHDPELLIFGQFLKAKGKIIIYDMHENLPLSILTKDWINKTLRNFIARSYRLLETLLLKNVYIIFAENSYAKYYDEKNYAIILNYPIVDELQRIKQKKNSTYSIGYIGGITIERGSIASLKALYRLNQIGRNVLFEMVGPITDSHHKELVKFIMDHDLKHVNIHGYMPFNKGWSIIARCHVGVALLMPHPNYIESYPTKLFEYMALGIPVIASDFPTYKKIVLDNDCGICVNPLNYDDIAEKIDYLLANPELAVEMGERGKLAVKQKYNWLTEEKKLLDFYNTVIPSSPSNRV